jgi:TonB family protein
MLSFSEETGASSITKRLRSSHTLSVLAHLILLPLIFAFNISTNKHPSRPNLHVVLLDPIARQTLTLRAPHVLSPPSPTTGAAEPRLRTEHPRQFIPTAATPPVAEPQLPLPPSLDTDATPNMTDAEDLLAKNTLGSYSAGAGGQGKNGGNPPQRSSKSCRVQSEDSARVPTTPLEILVKPKPAYTLEARELHLEGEVLLEVVFLASGGIQIVRVAHGLGHGLDENAAEAATHIHFKPASCAGAAIDMNATVHVTFRLPKREPSAE